MGRVKIFLFFLLMAASAMVRADVIVDNLEQPTQDFYGPIGDDSTTNDFLIGQEFTLPSSLTPYHLDKITLLLSATGGGGNITVSIWSVDSNDNPTNKLATVASQLVANAGQIDFVPETNVTLAPGIYFLVAEPTTPADSGFVTWAYAVSTNWTGSGTLGNIADTHVGTWVSYSIANLPQQMSLSATAMTPAIGIASEGGVTTLSWPSFLDGYVAETATSLSLSDWRSITNAPTSAAGNNTLTNSWSDPARCFRLRQSYVADNLNAATGGYFGPIAENPATNGFLIAQEFTLPDGEYTLDNVTLLLSPIKGSGSVSVSVWNVGSDNNPTNEIAAVASHFVTSPGNVSFVPTTPITLVTGSYFVVAAPTTSADDSKVGWAYTPSTAWTGFGTLGGYADTFTGSWENGPIGESPQQMSVQVTPTPQ
jgi:hypothetical protein